MYHDEGMNCAQLTGPGDCADQRRGAAWRSTAGRGAGRYIRMPNLPSIVVALLVAGTMLGGCGRQQESAKAEQAKPVSRTAERGPVKVTVWVDKDRAAVAEPLHLTLTVEAADGVAVTMPAPADELDKFHVRSRRDWPDAPVSGGRQWQQDYVLDSYVAGQQQIPALAAKFLDQRDPNNAIENDVESPPVTIQVISSLTGEFKPDEFADIKGAVPIPVPIDWKRLWWLAGVAGGAIVAVIASLLLWRRRKRRLLVARAVPPHQWAIAELNRLRAERLAEQGLVHELYFRLTMIVRQYIERRFAIQAAEQTTAEFLEAARRHPALDTTYRGLLSGFLRAGDLVKFALHRPEPPEIDQAFDTASTFVTRSSAEAEPAATEVAA